MRVIALDVNVVRWQRSTGLLLDRLAHGDEPIALLVLREAALILDVRDREVALALAGGDDGRADVDAVRQVAGRRTTVVVLEAVVVRLWPRVVDAREVLADVAVAKPVAAQIDGLARERPVRLERYRARRHPDPVGLRLLRGCGAGRHQQRCQDERKQAREAV